MISRANLWLTLAILFAAGMRQAVADSVLTRFTDKHCVSCHDASNKAGGLDLTALPWDLQNRAVFDQWVEVHDKVRKGEMPPKDEKRPPQPAIDSFLNTLDNSLASISRDRQKASGRTVLRRLNRTEYENTLHDLLGISVPLKRILPEDTPAHGYDTVAEGLRFSQLQIEKYLEAADVALNAAIDLGPAPTAIKERYSYKKERGVRENLDTPEGQIRDEASKEKHHVIYKELDDAVVFFSDGYSPTDLRQFDPQTTGVYRLRLSAYGYQSKGKPVTMRVYASNWREKRLLGYFDMPPDAPRVVEFDTELTEHEHLIVIPYETGYDDDGKGVWNVTASEFKGVGLAFQWIEVEGPLNAGWPRDSLKQLFPGFEVRELPRNNRPWRHGRPRAFELATDDPKAALRKVIPAFAERAFRRPLESGEADVFTDLALTSLDRGDSFEDAARAGLRAVLTAPQFLFLSEQPGELDDYALASRLSYFLWSTTPDEGLLKLASQGKLRDAKVRHAEVERLLNSPKSSALTTNFAGQWLDLRRINATSPDMRLYPEYDEMLPLAMVAETEAFFRELLVHDLSVANFIDSDFAMLNRRIAQHYGIELPAAQQTVSAREGEAPAEPQVKEGVRFTALEDVIVDKDRGINRSANVADAASIRTDAGSVGHDSDSHVGLNAAPYGEEFRRVPLADDSPRGGLMTQAAILKVTANGTVTSPVTRGVWVMKRLLGQPPSPPPPVPAVEPDTRGTTTIRDQLAAHRSSETCNSCHRYIDPPGFALESFDVIGGWREQYRSIEKGKQPSYKLRGHNIWQYKLALAVDSSGELADGRKFADIQSFKDLLMTEQDQVLKCVAEQLVIYGTGAGIEYADRPQIQNIVQSTEKKGSGLRTLIHQVIESELFRKK
jgi:hypothetical protein